jgi:hypothetical protein
MSKSFSVSYDTHSDGFVVLRKEGGQWRIIKTLFDYQVKAFREANRSEIEKGLIKITKQ